MVESLFLWGLRHAGRPPLPGEAVHAEHLLAALRIALDQAAPPRDPAVWQLDVTDDRTYTLRSGDHGWELIHGATDGAPPDVVVTTDTVTWTRYLMTPPDQRPTHPPGIELRGSADAIDRFRDRLAVFPYAISSNPGRTAPALPPTAVRAPQAAAARRACATPAWRLNGRWRRRAHAVALFSGLRQRAA